MSLILREDPHPIDVYMIFCYFTEMYNVYNVLLIHSGAKAHFIILLWLTSDNITCQGDHACLLMSYSNRNTLLNLKLGQRYLMLHP